MQSDLLDFLRNLLHRFSDFVPATISSTAVTSGKWELRGYSRESLPAEWTELPPEEKLATLDQLDPEFTRSTENATCIGLHELQARSLNPAENKESSLTRIAIGTDDSDPSTSDEELGNEVLDTDITESTVSGSVLIARGFIDTPEANENTIREVGSKSDSGTLLNRGTISTIEKTNAVAVSLRVQLSFEDGGSS